jgi:hypothetical protein
MSSRLQLIFSTINLPFPVLIHAIGLLILGLKLTFTPLSPATRENNVTLGIATTAIGLSYLSTSYVPIEQNTFLYASAPVRIILAAISGARLTMDHYMQRQRKGDGPKARLRKKLWGILLYDGLGGIFVGWWLGTFSGRIPAYQT